MLSIGICVRERRLSIAELLLKGQSLELKGAYELPFDGGSDLERNRVMLVQRLRELREKFKGEGVRFCFGLPQSQISSFPLAFPFKEKFKILKTLPFELEEKSPFPPETALFDARISQITDKGGCRALCFAALKESADGFLQLLKAAGLSPHLLTAEGSALANLIEGGAKCAFFPAGRRGSKAPALYLYLGLYESAALFFRGGALESVFAIDWGASAIISKMRERYHLGFEEALKEFFDKSFILTEQKGWTKEQAVFSRLIKSELAVLIPKIRLLELSLKTRSEGEIQEAAVFGPGSAVKNLSAFLSEELSLNFSRLRDLPKLPGLDLSDPKSHLFLIPFGLAVEGLKKAPYSGLNLIHSLKKPEAISLFPKSVRPALMALGAALFVWTAYSFLRDRESRWLADQIHSVFVSYGKKIALMRESQVDIDSVRDFLRDQKALAKNESLIKERISGPGPMDWLQTLTKGMDPKPEWDMRIAYLKLKDQKVSLAGEISGPYLEALKLRLQSLAKGPLEGFQPPKRSPQSLPEAENSSPPPPPPPFLEGGLQKGAGAAGNSRPPAPANRPSKQTAPPAPPASLRKPDPASPIKSPPAETSAGANRQSFAFSFELKRDI